MYLGTNEVQKIYLGSTQVYGRQWTPADITTMAWYDAADASTITLNGATVSQWDDKSGNELHLVQPVATSQPLYEPTGYNGLPTLTFDGVDDFFNNNNVALALGAGDFTMFFVCRTLSNNRTQMTAVRGSASSRMYLRSSGGSIAIIWGNEFRTQKFNVGGNQNHLLEWSMANGGGTVQTYTDGVLQSTDTVTMASLTSFTLHGYLNGGDCANGRSCELVIVSSILSITNRQKMEGYLAHKWNLAGNLPVDHPYKNAAPTI